MADSELAQIRRECWQFLISTVLTVLIFTVIALVAFWVQLFIEFIAQRGANAFLLQSLTIVDTTILICNLLFLIVLVVKHLPGFVRRNVWAF